MFLAEKYVSAATVNVIPVSAVTTVTPVGGNVYVHDMAPGDVCEIVNVCWVVVLSASWVGDTSTGLTAAVTVSATDAETPMTFVAVTVMIVGAKLAPGASENPSDAVDWINVTPGRSGEYDHVIPPVYWALCVIVKKFPLSVSRF
jgi:hypothetical protein